MAWRGEDGAEAEEVFNAIVICNGHYMVTLVPKIQRVVCCLLPPERESKWVATVLSGQATLSSEEGIMEEAGRRPGDPSTACPHTHDHA